MGGTVTGGMDESECPGGRMVFSLGKKTTKEAGFGRVDPGHEDRLFFRAEPAGDGSDLRDGFPSTVNDFGGAQAVLPLQVQFSESAGQNRAERAPSRHEVRRGRIAGGSEDRQWGVFPASWSPDGGG